MIILEKFLCNFKNLDKVFVNSRKNSAEIEEKLLEVTLKRSYKKSQKFQKNFEADLKKLPFSKLFLHRLRHQS